MRTGTLLACLATLLATQLRAQPAFHAPVPEWIATPAQPGAIPLYAGPAPGSEHATAHERWGRLMGGRMVHNVTAPTLTPVLPAAGKANGTAVIVAPGGAFMALSMDSEGYDVAHYLAVHGVTAFVLKYRLDPTPDDPAGFIAAIAGRVGPALKAGVGHVAPITNPQSIADGLRALALVRAQAAHFHIDPHRVGIIGFSAGAMVALSDTLAPDRAARPDFTGMIYGPMQPLAVPANAPPLFAALAIDDPLMARDGFGLVTSWQHAGRPVELHVFENGGHGFGMGHPPATNAHWPQEFVWWLQARGLLQATKP